MNHFKLIPTSLLAGLALAVAGSVGQAQVRELSLTEITNQTDNGVLGTIVGSRVVDLGNEVDGFGLYYTIVTIEGKSVFDDRKITVDIASRGGWIDKEHGIGSWDSEAPQATEIAVGREVLAYYMWSENIGSGVGANILYASHGSLFRTAKSPTGTVVLGRGQGYAIDKNIKFDTLRVATRKIRKEAQLREIEKQSESTKNQTGDDQTGK